MKRKAELFRESLKLVWHSAPVWATVNTILSIIRSFLPLLLLWLIKHVIDTITASASENESITPLIWPIIAVVAVWFLDEAFSDINDYSRKKQSLKFEDHMYDLLHSKAGRIDLINFENPEYYDCLSRAASEATWRPNSIVNNMISIARSLLSLLLMASILFSFSWIFAIILIAANIPGIWLKLHYAEILYNFHREQTPEARKTAYFNWLLTGDRPSRELRLFGLGNYFRELFRKSFLKQKEEELQILGKRTFIELLSDLFKAGAFLTVILMIASGTIEGKFSLGQMAVLLIAFRQLMVYIKDFLGSIAGLYEDSLFIGDTFEFLNLKEKITAIAPVSVPSELKKSIVAENLSFTYPGNNFKSIDCIDIEIKQGEIIAIVGPNGAGKSTLARLLCRLYDPESGTIKYDNTDIRHFEPEKYREQFSVIFQDFMLYNLTAGENIRMGNVSNEYSLEKIIESAKNAGVDDLIMSLPKGYDTVIGNLFPESRELSWGEWQKIAMARSFFRDAQVLILDEPTSALDPDTEHEIFNHFREIVKGRTAVLISHRLTNVALADRILVLNHGKIAESGSHEELMMRKGLYFSMYNKQKSRFKD
jgi:ATP-binding cassette subfamily B protein